jgi:hypothetical protein
MKIRLFLAALPFIGMYSGGSLATHWPMLFGMPFLLSWNLIWMAGTAAVLALLLYLDTRAEAGNPENATGGQS